VTGGSCQQLSVGVGLLPLPAAPPVALEPAAPLASTLVAPAMPTGVGPTSLVVGAAEALEPHRVAAYLLETAGLAHKWYHEHHVLDQPEPLRTARLVLARATQIVLRNALGILGISAPERM